MMVDEFKKNAVPWQSTVPQQMPWMSSYDSAAYAMQFGHQSIPAHLVNTNPSITNPITNAQHLLEQGHHIHPSLVSFSSPVNSMTIPSATACSTPDATLVSSNVTTATQSCPMLQNLIQVSPANLNYAQQTPMLQTIKPTGVPFDVTCSLTHIPPSASKSSETLTSHYKRRSTELEDDEPFKVEEPPTKQLLSEQKLFKQFGSLQIDGSFESNDSKATIVLDDSEEELIEMSTSNGKAPGREEFNRYVYLLFKDKKGEGSSFTSDSTFDRLFREERDKLNKALVLWNPSVRSPDAIDDGDEDEEEEFNYSDHKDFLKDGLQRRDIFDDDDSIIITEVTDDNPCTTNTVFVSGNNESIQWEQDDLMLE